jgi:hypothetical protein
MPPEFRVLLPPWLAKLVADTETATGVEIEVTVDANAVHLSVDFDGSFVRMVTPSMERFRPASVYHELLHVRRNLLEGVPRLDAVGTIEDNAVFDCIRVQAAKEDNVIEHLIIGPMELERFPERRDYWEQIVRRNLAEVAAGAIAAQQQTATLIGTWVFLRRALDESAVKGELLQVLQARGLETKAEQAAQSILGSLADKPALVRSWFAALGHDISLAELVYLQPGGRPTFRSLAEG